LTDVTIPSDRNISQKDAEKRINNKNVSVEIQQLWNIKCFVIPIIIGPTVIVNKS
jgi:hypothetical protein